MSRSFSRMSSRVDNADLVDAETWRENRPVMMARVGKKAAGRELDGRTWDEFPEVRA